MISEGLRSVGCKLNSDQVALSVSSFLTTVSCLWGPGSGLYSGLGFCQEVRTEKECTEELRVSAGITGRARREVRSLRF